MKNSLIVLSIVFLAVGFTVLAYGMGAPFTEADCSMTLVQHKAYTDQSSWKFSGTCKGGVTFEVLGAWNLSEHKARESIQGTGNSSQVNGAITASCPNDPWLNISSCTAQAISGNFVNYITVYTTTPYPLSAGYLSSAQKSALLAEAQANGHSPATPPPPPPPPGKKTMKPHIAVAKLAVPKILKPTPGTLYHSSVPVQVSPPSGSSEKKVRLEFQVLLSGGWVTKAVVAQYDTGVNPSGISISKNQFPDKGNWRIRAKMATPQNAPWCGWVQFQLQ